VTNSEFIIVYKGMCVFMIFLQLISNPFVLPLLSYSYASTQLLLSCTSPDIVDKCVCDVYGRESDQGKVNGIC